MSKPELNNEEVGLLLYLESCSVDKDCLINTLKMNRDDWALMEKFKKSNLLDYGRITYKSIKNSGETTWVLLSDEAIKLAHHHRRERIKNNWKNKTFLTTGEKTV